MIIYDVIILSITYKLFTQVSNNKISIGIGRSFTVSRSAMSGIWYHGYWKYQTDIVWYIVYQPYQIRYISYIRLIFRTLYIVYIRLIFRTLLFILVSLSLLITTTAGSDVLCFPLFCAYEHSVMVIWICMGYTFLRWGYQTLCSWRECRHSCRISYLNNAFQ